MFQESSKHLADENRILKLLSVVFEIIIIVSNVHTREEHGHQFLGNVQEAGKYGRS